MNTELLEALNLLEKEKDISKETLLDAIENSLLNACKNHFGKADNIKLTMDRETCDYQLYAEKEVVEEVEDTLEQISLEDAQEIDSKLGLGDIVRIPIESKSFGRIATQNAKNLILQKIREEERKVIYDQYFEKEKDIVTGIVQRYVGRNISINLGKADAMLTENEQVKGEVFKPTERIKLYVVEVKNTTKGPKILVSRTHPELVKRLFESEVTEVRDGIVEACSRNGGKGGWQLYSISRWSREDGRKLRRHLEIEFEEKKNTQIYWDDVALFCYPQEYRLGIREMKKDDIIEIDNLYELAQIDLHYRNYEMGGAIS